MKETLSMGTDFIWTDEAVQAFARVYCGAMPKGFEDWKYHKLRMSEKIEVFKQDWAELYPESQQIPLKGKTITITIQS